MLGVAMKGQELIYSMKVRNLANDFNKIELLITSYTAIYRMLPGDDSSVVSHVGGTLASTPTGMQGNGMIDGLWNSHVDTDESYLVWQHIRLANLDSGSTNVTGIPATGNDYLPVNSVGGEMGIQSNNGTFTTITNNSNGVASAMTGSFIICSQQILGKYVKQLDIELDDGNTDTGSVRVNDPHFDGKSVSTASIADSNFYTVCMGV